VLCKLLTYLDILNRLGVDHQCDGRTDRTDGRHCDSNSGVRRAPKALADEIAYVAARRLSVVVKFSFLALTAPLYEVLFVVKSLVLGAEVTMQSRKNILIFY